MRVGPNRVQNVLSKPLERVRKQARKALAPFLPLLSMTLAGCDGTDYAYFSLMALVLITLPFALNWAHKRDQSRNEPKPFVPVQPTCHISELSGQQDLMNKLWGGYTVTLYRGFWSEHLPEVGKPYTRPWKGGEGEPKKMERLMEKVRLEQFPHMPSRITSIFATDTLADTKDYGEPYEIEISFKPNAICADRRPLAWLSRDTFEWIASADLDGSLYTHPKDGESMISAYWSETARPGQWSDILIDPELVSVVVKKKC